MSVPVQPSGGSPEGVTGAGVEHGAGRTPVLPDGPELMPQLVLIVAVAWTVLLVTAFFLYLEVDAVADFFPTNLGDLPFEVIWFGAVGGLVISLEGVFRHNRDWRPSYNYWHYMRPVVGAIIGTLGCLVFIVLTEAATKSVVTRPNPVFYDVIALSIGYREASFRALIGRLIDAVILPPGQAPATKTATDVTASLARTDVQA